MLIMSSFGSHTSPELSQWGSAAVEAKNGGQCQLIGSSVIHLGAKNASQPSTATFEGMEGNNTTFCRPFVNQMSTMAPRDN